jgi:glycosyltransferase involved in cell wall biosynthesis
LSFIHPDIKIINNSKDYETGEPYNNRGTICRDAITHASGDYFMLMDDDDIYLPWYIEQAYEELIKSGRDAWKPAKSFFATPTGFELAQNVMEASVIVKMNRIREIGFNTEKTGEEGLSWYTKLRDEGHIIENEINYIPSYCFNWSGSTGNSAHKQSGDINNPNNFETHKENCFDIPNRKIQVRNLYFLYYPYIDFIRKNYDLFNQEFYKKYLNGLPI